jgi:hypothetical protein
MFNHTNTIITPLALSKNGDITIPMHQKLMVGAAAGVIGTSCVFPIDVCKTRLQNQRPDPKTGRLMYKGMIDCFRTIVRTEGITSMYKGLGPNLVGVTPEKAIKLAANDVFREILTSENGDLSVPLQMLAGASAGFCQVSATNPMEIVKLRMQLQNLKPAAERLSAMQVVKSLGLRGLYKGTPVTWARDVPYSIVFFPLYSEMRDFMSDENGHAGIPSILTAGSISGATAAFLCTPADMIKTRVQAEGNQYKGGIDCLKKTVAAEGYGSLFKGSLPRMMVTAPLFGIALLAFELQKRYIKGEFLL